MSRNNATYLGGTLNHDENNYSTNSPNLNDHRKVPQTNSTDIYSVPGNIRKADSRGSYKEGIREGISDRRDREREHHDHQPLKSTKEPLGHSYDYNSRDRIENRHADRERYRDQRDREVNQKSRDRDRDDRDRRNDRRDREDRQSRDTDRHDRRERDREARESRYQEPQDHTRVYDSLNSADRELKDIRDHRDHQDREAKNPSHPYYRESRDSRDTNRQKGSYQNSGNRGNDSSPLKFLEEFDSNNKVNLGNSNSTPIKKRLSNKERDRDPMQYQHFENNNNTNGPNMYSQTNMPGEVQMIKNQNQNLNPEMQPQKTHQPIDNQNPSPPIISSPVILRSPKTNRSGNVPSHYQNNNPSNQTTNLTNNSNTAQSNSNLSNSSKDVNNTVPDSSSTHTHTTAHSNNTTKPIPEHTKLFRKDALTGFTNRSDDDPIGMSNRLRYITHYDYRSILFNFTACRKALFLCNSGKSDAPGSKAAIDKASFATELEHQQKLLYYLKSKTINLNKVVTPMAKPTERFAIESIQKEHFLPNYYQQMKINRKIQSRGYHSIANCPEGSVVLEDALADVVSGTENVPIPNDNELTHNMYTIPKFGTSLSSQGFPLIEDLSSQYLRTHFNLCPSKAEGTNFLTDISPRNKRKNGKGNSKEAEAAASDCNSHQSVNTSLSSNIYNSANYQSNISEHCSPTIHYVGTDPKFGPICISLFRFLLYSKLTVDYHSAYRICVRTVDHDQTLRCTVFESAIPTQGQQNSSNSGAIASNSSSSKGNNSNNQSSNSSSLFFNLSSSSNKSASQAAHFLHTANSFNSTNISTKSIINFVCPELDIREFRQVQAPKAGDIGPDGQPIPAKRIRDPLTEILKLDELRSCSRNDQKKRKIGILLQLPGQTSERELYNNQCGTENFRIFLDWLGTRIKLKGFNGYNGGLDCKRDQTGKDSYYTKFKNYEIMFHVGTLLPFSDGSDPSSVQQLARKRHIGNDIITIIFQDEPKENLESSLNGTIELNDNPPTASNLQLPFEPDTIKSHFQHVFIVVRASGRDERTRLPLYQIEVVKSRDIPVIPPTICHFSSQVPNPSNSPSSFRSGASNASAGSNPNSSNLFIADSNLREYVLSKLINAENLAKTFAHNFKFAECCTRKNLLEDLVKDFAYGEKLVKPVSKLNMFAATTRKAFGLKGLKGSSDGISSERSKSSAGDSGKNSSNSSQFSSDRYANSYQLTKTDSKGGLAWPVYLRIWGVFGVFLCLSIDQRSSSVKRDPKPSPPERPKQNSSSTIKVPALLAISWCRLMLIVSDNSSDRVIFSIPTKAILGWQAYGKQCRLFYGNCEAIQFFITTGATAGYQAIALSKDPAKDITYRLSNCTPGHDCLTLNPKPQTSLKSGKTTPVHNFEIDDKFRVVAVESKSHAYQIGLRPGHLIVEANKTLASDFESYRDLKRIIETGQSLSILVVPAPPEYRKNKNAVSENLHNESIYHRIPKLSYGMPCKKSTQVDPPPLSTNQLPSVAPDGLEDTLDEGLFNNRKYINPEDFDLRSFDNHLTQNSGAGRHARANRMSSKSMGSPHHGVPLESQNLMPTKTYSGQAFPADFGGKDGKVLNILPLKDNEREQTGTENEIYDNPSESKRGIRTKPRMTRRSKTDIISSPLPEGVSGQNMSGPQDHDDQNSPRPVNQLSTYITDNLKITQTPNHLNKSTDDILLMQNRSRQDFSLPVKSGVSGKNNRLAVQSPMKPEIYVGGQRQRHASTDHDRDNDMWVAPAEPMTRNASNLKAMAIWGFDKISPS